MSIDIDATLATIRALCSAIESDNDELSRYTTEYAEALVPLFRELDGRLIDGERPPRQWRTAFQAHVDGDSGGAL